jgi:hypothetical protein
MDEFLLTFTRMTLRSIFRKQKDVIFRAFAEDWGACSATDFGGSGISFHRGPWINCGHDKFAENNCEAFWYRQITELNDTVDGRRGGK